MCFKFMQELVLTIWLGSSQKPRIKLDQEAQTDGWADSVDLWLIGESPQV